MHDFTKLEVYDEAVALTSRFYGLAKTLPRYETFGLASQIRRAAASVPSNIAEGAGRDDARDFARFLRIAIGSLCELQAQVHVCEQIEIGDEVQRAVCESDLVRLRRRIKTLERKIRAQSE